MALTVPLQSGGFQKAVLEVIKDVATGFLSNEIYDGFNGGKGGGGNLPEGYVAQTVKCYTKIEVNEQFRSPICTPCGEYQKGEGKWLNEATCTQYIKLN